MILTNIPSFHPVTEEREGKIITLVLLPLNSIKYISADPETGNAVLHYLMPTDSLETGIPFSIVLDSLNKQNLVDTSVAQTAKGISKKFDKHLKDNYGI